MPPQRGPSTTATSFNNRRPFQPPRPAGASSNRDAPSRSKAKGKAPVAAIDISSSDSDDDAASDRDLGQATDDESAREKDDDEDEQMSDAEDFGAFRRNPKSIVDKSTSSKSTTRQPQRATPVNRTSRANAEDDDLPDGPPPIPQKLLVRLLHDGFEDPNTKIGKEAMAVVTKYIETFVRESIARAVLERQEAGDQTQSRSGGLSSGFLQVEDLEKLGPQLILDF